MSTILQLMKQQRIFLFALLLLAILASCSPGHLGGNEIAFVRNGQLWTVDPNGANAFAVVAPDTSVVGYAWSPNHQMLAFRALDIDFAKTSTARHLLAQPTTGLIGDVPATMNTVGIDGGTAIPIMPSNVTIQYSNPIWNPTGTRLLYRQTSTTPPFKPDNAVWMVSQNDQPEAIAAKQLPSSYSIPSISYNNPKAIGNFMQGTFTTALDGTNIHYFMHTSLPGHPLPASLERILWQPGQQHTAILYAVVNTSPQTTQAGSFTVQLILDRMDNHPTVLTTCACTQFAWSPDGNHILYSTGSTYTVLTITTLTSFKIAAEERAVPYWSPDSQFLLLDAAHTLRLIDIKSQHQQLLLKDTETPGTASSPLPGVDTLLQPVANSVWSADSRHFLFLTHNRLLWQNQPLSAGKGLYTATIDTYGQPQGIPTVVDTGNDSMASWTYEDANTSFLY